MTSHKIVSKDPYFSACGKMLATREAAMADLSETDCPECLAAEFSKSNETVDHPQHYNENSKGIECIDVVEELTFNTGNAIKYLWRAGHKGDIIEDLKKSRWYIDREIQRLGGEA